MSGAALQQLFGAIICDSPLWPCRDATQYSCVLCSATLWFLHDLFLRSILVEFVHLYFFSSFSYFSFWIGHLGCWFLHTSVCTWDLKPKSVPPTSCRSMPLAVIFGNQKWPVTQQWLDKACNLCLLQSATWYFGTNCHSVLHIAWNLWLLCNPPLHGEGSRGERAEREWMMEEWSGSPLSRQEENQRLCRVQRAARKSVVDSPSRGTLVWLLDGTVLLPWQLEPLDCQWEAQL